MANPETDALIDALVQSLGDGTFVKLSLGKGRDGHTQASLRRVEIRGEPHLSVLLRRQGAADLTENHPLARAAPVVRDLLATRFENAHLFTTGADIELRTNRRGEPHLARRPATFQATPPPAHDRPKRYVLDPGKASYLERLGVVGGDGRVKSDKADKYRQMQNIIKILDEVVSRSELPSRARPRVVDMGCGKGYLTFALHDYFRNYRGLDAEVIGVDRNRALMDLCHGVARDLRLDGLRFECGDVDTYEGGRIDLSIALHACDTATDTAIYKGIVAGASIILTVPCCQKELRPQFRTPPEEQPIFKHDTFKDRFSQTLTDTLRGLLLETRGYRTRIMEFISDAHTHRNVMILGVHGEDYRPGAQRRKEIAALKERYGIAHQHLETLLETPAGATAPDAR